MLGYNSAYLGYRGGGMWMKREGLCRIVRYYVKGRQERLMYLFLFVGDAISVRDHSLSLSLSLFVFLHACLFVCFVSLSLSRLVPCTAGRIFLAFLQESSTVTPALHYTCTDTAHLNNTYPPNIATEESISRQARACVRAFKNRPSGNVH